MSEIVFYPGSVTASEAAALYANRLPATTYTARAPLCTCAPGASAGPYACLPPQCATSSAVVCLDSGSGISTGGSQWADLSLSGNSLSMAGGFAATPVAGPAGGGVLFDGASSYGVAATFSPAITTAHTTSLWIYPLGAPGPAGCTVLTCAANNPTPTLLSIIRGAADVPDQFSVQLSSFW